MQQSKEDFSYYSETGIISSPPLKMAAISSRTQRCQVLNFLTLASIILEIGVCVMSIRLQGMQNCTSSDRTRSHNTCLGSVIYEHWRSPDRGSGRDRECRGSGIADGGSGIVDQQICQLHKGQCELFVD